MANSLSPGSKVPVLCGKEKKTEVHLYLPFRSCSAFSSAVVMTILAFFFFSFFHLSLVSSGKQAQAGPGAIIMYREEVHIEHASAQNKTGTSA